MTYDPNRVVIAQLTPKELSAYAVKVCGLTVWTYDVRAGHYIDRDNPQSTRHTAEQKKESTK